MNDKKPIAAGKSSFNLVNHKKLFKELEIDSSDILLDLGCGEGKYSLAISEFFNGDGTIYAVDLWKDGIESLKSVISEKGINNIYPVIADISTHIPLDNMGVDICLIVTVLHDLVRDKTYQGTLQELTRILKPGGKLAIVEFKKIYGPPGPPIGIRLSPEDVEELLRRYSFRHSKTVDVGTYHFLSIFLMKSQE